MVRLIAVLLTILTGFAGLVYEVAWQKYLAALLGSHGEATAAVLAIFLGGLSVGYALFGRATRRVLERARRSGRRPRLLAFYARVEAGIGVYALLFPILFGVAQTLSLYGPVDREALGFAFDVVLSGLLIGPPAVLMGGTIPILTLALAGDIGHATRVHAWIYGANTLGAFAGALAGGFWLIPLLGLDGVVWTMGGLNLLAALVFAALERRANSVAPDTDEPRIVEPVPRIAAWSGIALLAGFAMMALQTTLNRIGAIALGSSNFTFAMVVAVFVLALALGSFAVSALNRIPRALVAGSQWLLVVLLFPLYLWMGDAGYWAHLIRVRVGGVHALFFDYQLAVLFWSLAVLAVPIGLSGALLPLLFHQLRREVRNLGAVAGRLYAWNTVGSLLGALLGGYLLLIWLDLHHVFRLAMVCSAVAASILSLLVLERVPRVVFGLVLSTTVAAIALLPAWPVDHLTPGTYRSRKAVPWTFQGADAFFESRKVADFIFYDDDPTSSVSVGVPLRNPRNIALYVNGKPEGALEGDYPTMALTALIPALIADDVERIMVIGLGTGVTAGVFAELEGTQQVTVAEISRAVIAANPLFAAGNFNLPTNPKVEIIRGDAYRTLLRSTERYDVIASEPSNPWVAGVEMLYTQEFLAAVRSKLAPGGVYAQWFHIYETDRAVVELILRTYASVFPNVSVWFAGGPDLLLLGIDRPERALDVGALEARFRQPDFAAQFERMKIDRFPQLLAHELIPLGTVHAEELSGPIHTVRRPLLSDLAARAFFVGNQVTRIGPFASPKHRDVAIQNSLLRRYGGGGAVLSDELFEIAAREVCRFKRAGDCSSILARWSVDHPDSTLWRATLASLRRGSRARNPTLSTKRLERLRALYTGQYLRSEDDPAEPEAARRATDLLLDHYHHVIPFDPNVIDEIWAHCASAACEAERASARELVWGRDGGAS